MSHKNATDLLPGDIINHYGRPATIEAVWSDPMDVTAVLDDGSRKIFPVSAKVGVVASSAATLVIDCEVQR